LGKLEKPRVNRNRWKRVKAKKKDGKESTRRGTGGLNIHLRRVTGSRSGDHE